MVLLFGVGGTIIKRPQEAAVSLTEEGEAAQSVFAGRPDSGVRGRLVGGGGDSFHRGKDAGHHLKLLHHLVCDAVGQGYFDCLLTLSGLRILGGRLVYPR